MAEKNSRGTPTDLGGDAVEEISSTLRRLLADVTVISLLDALDHENVRRCILV
jgi:hypothetical protein